MLLTDITEKAQGLTPKFASLLSRSLQGIFSGFCLGLGIGGAFWFISILKKFIAS
jgi:hypothetical protein